LQKENQYQKDPHIWLGIKNTKFIASKIKDKLVSLKPEKKDIFVKNYNNFVLELDKLIQ
jgi:zinc transport system substrate-binding protein